MILGATALAQLAVGGTSGASVSAVELAASVQIQSQLTAQISISGAAVPIGESLFASHGIVDQAKSLFLVANNKRGTLASAIDTDDLSITVTGNISSWPTSGALTLDLASGATDTSNEIVYYDGKSGQVITLVGRGKDGSTAKSFASGSRVSINPIAETHNLLARTLIDVEAAVLEQRAELDTKASQTELDAKLSLAGGTMAGVLTLAGPPTASLHAATKAYVDSSSGGGGGIQYRLREYDARDYLEGDGVTDDTAALQTLLNQIGTDAQNATIYLDDVTYLIAGPLQDTSRRNAQLLLPMVDALGQQYSIKFSGAHAVAFGAGGNVGVLPNLPCGTRLKSTLAAAGGTEPSMICGRGALGGSFDEISAVTVEFENLTIQTVPNPPISAINMRRVAACNLRDVAVIAGNYMSAPEMTEPTVTTSYGIILPDFNKSILCKLTNSVNILGFYTGMRAGELMHAENLGFWMNQCGIEFGFSYHASLIERMLVFWCTTGAYWSNVHPVHITQWDNEHTPIGEIAWYASTYDIFDAGNAGDGDITWITIQAAVGRVSNFVVNGGTGLKIRELGT